MVRSEFEVRFGWSTPLLAVLGTGPRRTRLAVEGDELVMQMGWAFHTRIPLTSLWRVYRDQDRWRMGVGVHGWRGTWTVNGAMGPIVAVDLDPPATARILSVVEVRLQRLRVSVTDPDHVVETLHALAQPG